MQLAEIAARHHWAPMNCLRRSLVQKRQCWLGAALRQPCISACAWRRPGQWRAHAWLSADDHLLNDTAEHIAGYQDLMPDAWDHLPLFTPD